MLAQTHMVMILSMMTKNVQRFMKASHMSSNKVRDAGEIESTSLGETDTGNKPAGGESSSLPRTRTLWGIIEVQRWCHRSGPLAVTKSIEARPVERARDSMGGEANEHAVLRVVDLGDRRLAMHRVPVSGLGEDANGHFEIPVQDDLR